VGNQISQQLENDYQQYMESSNEILTDMVGNLNSKSLQEIGKLSNIGSRNSQALYFISYIVHFLYGNEDSLIHPFDPPNEDANMVGQLCYDMVDLKEVAWRRSSPMMVRMYLEFCTTFIIVIFL
jgi:hypothetical protein